MSLRATGATAQIGALVDGFEVRCVEFRTDKTLYVCIGNLFVYLCLAFLLTAPALEWILRKKEKDEEQAS